MSNQVLPSQVATDAALSLDEVWQLCCTGRMTEALVQAVRLNAQAVARENEADQAWASLYAGQCCFQLGRNDEAFDHVAKAVAAFHAIGDAAGEARALAVHTILLSQRADCDLALEEGLRALELSRQSGDLLSESYALTMIGCVYWALRQPERGLPLLEDAVDIVRRISDDLHLARWLVNVAGVQLQIGLQARERGDQDGGTRWLRLGVETADEAIGLARQTGDSWTERLLLCNAAETLVDLGELETASRYLDEHDAIGGEIGRRAEAQYQFTRGYVLSARGAFGEAIERFKASLVTEQDGDLEQAILSAQHLANAYEAVGRYKDALESHKKFHALYAKIAESGVQRRAGIAAVGFETEKLRRQAMAAQHRAMSLESQNLDLLQEAERLSRSVLEDSLTQLPNRRRLQALLSETLGRGEPYSIAMLDVDHFKMINDTTSHVMGDRVLREIGAILRQTCRQNDVPTRYGGEEFAIVIHGIQSGAATKLCERLRAAIAGHDWQARLQIAPVTVSIGIASWFEAESPEAVLEVADKRLYIAKALGRNRVVDSSAP
jgi:diguanylate cyclase (GGDEF)-like protein